MNTAATAEFQELHNDTNFKLESRTKRNHLKDLNAGTVI
jgi:hypothetical protein